MSEPTETVRDVCEDIQLQTYQTMFRTSDVIGWSDRTLDAHERDLAANDADIARLKAALKPVEDLGISPAPWTVVRVTRQKEAVVKASDNAIVATMHEDNARLIAAAPDLYHALREVVEAFDRGDGLPMTIKEARSALEKAAGDEVAK